MKMLPLLIGIALGVSRAMAQTTTLVTFSNGNEGWDGPQGFGGVTTVDSTGGNPTGNLHTVFQDFGIEFSTTTNAAWLGDHTLSTSITLAFDLMVTRINFFGMDVSRPVLIDLRDYNTSGPYPWTSVWYKFTDMSAATNGTWNTYQIIISETLSGPLPTGWGGSGDEDPITFEPRLPPSRTFASVLASVDEVAISTYEPGWFFGETEFDVRVDNLRITKTPRQIGGLCGPADVGSQGGAVGPDGWLDNNDFVVFIGWFFLPDARADRGIQGGQPGTDGQFDNNDFIVFINQFFAGCAG